MHYMKRLRSVFFGLVLAFSLVFATAVPAHAQIPTPWEQQNAGCVVNDVATIQGVGCLLSNVLNVAITFIGLAAFVMLIVGAFGYMLSGGNSKGTETARNTITFAIVGIVVALSAFIILNLISSFTGVDEVTQFEIPGSDEGFTNSTTGIEQRRYSDPNNQ
jgi:hypothetical protein